MAKIENVFKENVKKAENHPKRITKWIHYTKLVANTKQYRGEIDKEELEALADLIEADGEVLQNLLVSKIDTDEYKIIAGHSRKAACQILVEERNRPEFAFLPCFVSDVSDVKEEFRVYSSNGRIQETPYEIMHKIERMKWLITNYPEEFPHLQTGKMVNRLAKQLKMSKTTVGEYQMISANLSENAMEAFKNGEIDKSAAVTLASLPETEQENVLDKGITKDKEIKDFVKENLEPDKDEVIRSYDFLHIEKIDKPNRKDVVKKLIENYGKKHHYQSDFSLDLVVKCTPKHITINGKTVTWTRYGHLLDTYKPYALKTADENVLESNKAEEHAVEDVSVQYEAKTEVDGADSCGKADDTDTGKMSEIQESWSLSKQRTERVPAKVIRSIEMNLQPFLVVKGVDYRKGEVLKLIGVSEGRTTGDTVDVFVSCVRTADEESGLKPGYSILGVTDIQYC